MKKAVIIIFFVVSAIVVILAVIFSLSNHKQNNFPESNQDNKLSDQFLAFQEAKEKLPLKSEEVSLIAVGDIMLSRNVGTKMVKKEDYNYPFLKTAEFTKNADITFGNLETTIIAGRPIQTGEMLFRADPEVVSGLNYAGFDVLSLANNHILNFGAKGLNDTFNYLTEAEIDYVGAGKSIAEAYETLVKEIKGVKFAFLAFSYTTSSEKVASMDTENMIEAVKQAKKKADFVIVSMHAGTEYAERPNQSQINFAHAAIDAGAELVIGHHPHVVQTMERYKDKYIFYSLGNFIFDQMWSEDTKRGLILKIFFNQKGVIKIEPLAVLIEDYAQPQMMENSDAEKVLERLDYSLKNQLIFSWNKEKSTFEQKERKVIYSSDNKEDNKVKVLKSEIADLDQDSQKEKYHLENGKIVVSQDDKIIWESLFDWWVDDFVLADATGDGIIDLNLSVWKSGNYGNSKPFWVKENEQTIKNHFFVFNLNKGKLNPVWQSSNLENPNCQIVLTDGDNDGKNDLLVIEGDYQKSPSCEGKYVALWQWNGWGFTNEWRSAVGHYQDLKIERIEEKNHLIVDNLSLF